jgi:nitrogen fixation NifU-like protein
MAAIEDLYQEIILEHNQRPRNFGPLPGATHRADGRIPLCGDEISVSLRKEGDRLVELRFQGQGCAICKASASLMTEALKGMREEEARALIERVRMVMSGQGAGPQLDDLGELAALSALRRFPARVQCAALAWEAAESALRTPACAPGC